MITRKTLMVVLKNLNSVPDCASNSNLIGAGQPDKSLEIDEEFADHSLETAVNVETQPSEQEERHYDSKVIPWTEFTEDFHMTTPEFSTVEQIC